MADDHRTELLASVRSAAEVLRRCDDTPPTLADVAELVHLPAALVAEVLGCCADHPCCEPIVAA